MDFIHFTLRAMVSEPLKRKDFSKGEHQVVILENSLWWVVGLLVGEGNDAPLQYSCLENPMDGGTW